VLPAVATVWVLSVLLSGCLSGTWHNLASASFARQEVSYVYDPQVGEFFLAGGLSTVQEAYNPVTNTWHTVAPLPVALDHIQAVDLNGLIYYLGGLAAWPRPSVGTDSIYDPVTDRVTAGASMPAGRDRGAGGVAVHDGRIYYAGGLHNGTAVPWFDVYDPATDQWSSLPDLPEPRDHFQAAVVGDRFYAIGGRNTSIDATTTVNDAFDFTTGTWVTGLAPLPTARGGFATAALGTTILVIGGEGDGRTYSTVEAYDTTTDDWTQLASMPTARHGIEGATCNGGIYIADGGTVQGGAGPTSVQQVLFPSDEEPCP
jgi:N-acetylneuraminic acid mutarotase